jgi:SAM-dependent methyltransferase
MVLRLCLVFTFGLLLGLTALLGLLGLPVLSALLSKPTRALLARDLGWLEAAMPGALLKEYRELKEFGADDVVEYYTRTTFRDYRLLEIATGSNAMHSKLVPRVRLPFEAGHLRQLLYVIGHTGSACRNVLEIGSGKGGNSIFLAHLLPHVNFVAVDLVPDHVRVATGAARAANLNNISFVLGDASACLPACLPAIDGGADQEFDLIFGIESLCHLDTPGKMSGFMGAAGPALRAGGKLVIVDGFRSGGADNAAEQVREAMNLAESGFRIRRMPSKEGWVALGMQHGLMRVQDIDLTPEALAFWTRGWRAARLLTALFPSLVRRYLRSADRCRRETGANFVAVLMTAYAMALGSAEYGVLTLEKQ